MDEVVPIQFINNQFKTQIKSLKETHRSTRATFYKANTAYGTMNLVVENYSKEFKGQNTLNFLDNRNLIIQKMWQFLPLIYEQHIFVNHPEQIMCISLTEDYTVLEESGLGKSGNVKVISLEHLVKSIALLWENNGYLEGEINEKSLLVYRTNKHIGIDFSCINVGEFKTSEEIEKLVNFIEHILSPSYSQLREIILIQDKLYRYDPSLIRNAKDILEIILFLNLHQDIVVEIKIDYKSENEEVNKNRPQIKKIKPTLASKLNGTPKFTYRSKFYDNFIFIDGKCINSLKEIGLESLKDNFIKDNWHYRLRKNENLIIELSEQGLNDRWREDIITVHPPVAKIELVSFIMAYMRWIEPLINSIVYNDRENSLRIEFVSKNNLPRVVRVVFYDDYVIKDEEISMILEKARIKDCKLDLRYMKINDTLLMFLANCDKMNKITELYLSDCYGLSENGINVLLVSPFCKNLESLSLLLEENLLNSAVEFINLKSGLKRLSVERKRTNKLEGNVKTEINAEKMKLEELNALGVRVLLPSLNKNLKVLKIDQEVPMEDFKFLKNLSLLELKIKIIEGSKRSLIESTSSFFSGAKHSALKVFAEGNSQKTLKFLDISFSSVKFKSLKCLLLMPEIEKLGMNSCSNLGNDFEPISPRILIISLSNTAISIDHLSKLLLNTQVLIELNLSNTNIVKEELVKYVVEKKKFINNLVVSEKNYSSKLIEKMIDTESHNGFEFVENVSLLIETFLEDHYQDAFFRILKKVSKTPKNLTLLTHNNENQETNEESNKTTLLIDRIHRFMLISSLNLKNFKNLFINKVPFEEAYELYKDNGVHEEGEVVDSKLQLESDSCKVISSPKKIQKKESLRKEKFIELNILPYETIDKVMKRLVHLKRKEEEEAILSVNLKGNKMIGKEIISLISEYFGENLIGFNFQECIFELEEVIDSLFQFWQLETLNGGEFYLKLTPDNFSVRSQKYLRMLMKLNRVEMLKIECINISETEILFPVLDHVLEKHSSSLNKLHIRMENVAINQDCNAFFDKMSCLERLTNLSMDFEKCTFAAMKNSTYWEEKIAKLMGLTELSLRMPSSIMPQMQLKRLEIFSFAVSEEKD